MFSGSIAIDGIGTNKYSYDAGGQLLSEDGPWPNDTVSYTYDNRLRSSLGLAAPEPGGDGWTQSYTYDDAKRLKNITSPAGIFSYLYPDGVQNLVSSIGLPGGSFITNIYDPSARLLGTWLEKNDATILNSHTYGYNQGNQRTQQVFKAANYVNYAYDPIGQLKTAAGKESGGVTNRFHEQFGYDYDQAGNLNWRTNNDLLQSFAVNSLNELTTSSRNTNMTVAGTTTSPATNVTVNTLRAALYGDSTFARTNMGLVDGDNTFTAVARDSYGRESTDTTVSYLPSSISFVYDLNGNLRTNGTRVFDYDDENQLVRVTQPTLWKSEFAYDGKLRRRVRREYQWSTVGGLSTELFTSVMPSTTLRNGHPGWVGCQVHVGVNPMTVTELGRWVVSGNSATHTVKIVQTSGEDLPGASVSVATAGATPGQFKYVALSSPVVLSANTTYFLMSHEAAGGDYWYDYDTTLTPTDAASIPGSVYTNDGATNCMTYGAADFGYVPPGLKYAGAWLQTNAVRYVYDGNLVLQERWLDLQPATSNLQQSVTYTRGRDISGTLEGAGGIGGLLARYDSGLWTQDSGHRASPSVAYYHSDGNGNITTIVNSNQAVVAKYLYDPYGNVLSINGPLADANVYRFSSKEAHANSGLAYYLYRLYEPAAQRWINLDPLGEQGFEGARQKASRVTGVELNRYEFVHNDPANGCDQYGLFCFEVTTCCIGWPSGTVNCMVTIQIGGGCVGTPPFPVTVPIVSWCAMLVLPFAQCISIPSIY